MIFWCTTLQDNVNHTGTLLRYLSRAALTWWRNVDVIEIMPFTDEDKHLTLLQRETPEFIPQRCGHPIRRILIRWTTTSEVFFEREGLPFAERWCQWVERTSPETMEATGPVHHRGSSCAVACDSRLSASVLVNGGHFEQKFWTYDFLVYFVHFIDTGLSKFYRYKHLQSVNIAWHVLLLCLTHGTFRVYFKRGVQPKCGVQDWKMWSPK